MDKCPCSQALRIAEAPSLSLHRAFAPASNRMQAISSNPCLQASFKGVVVLSSKSLPAQRAQFALAPCRSELHGSCVLTVYPFEQFIGFLGLIGFAIPIVDFPGGLPFATSEGATIFPAHCCGVSRFCHDLIAGPNGLYCMLVETERLRPERGGPSDYTSREYPTWYIGI